MLFLRYHLHRRLQVQAPQVLGAIVGNVLDNIIYTSERDIFVPELVRNAVLDEMPDARSVVESLYIIVDTRGCVWCSACDHKFFTVRKPHELDDDAKTNDGIRTNDGIIGTSLVLINYIMLCHCDGVDHKRAVAARFYDDVLDMINMIIESGTDELGEWEEIRIAIVNKKQESGSSDETV